MPISAQQSLVDGFVHQILESKRPLYPLTHQLYIRDDQWRPLLCEACVNPIHLPRAGEQSFIKNMVITFPRHVECRESRKKCIGRKFTIFMFSNDVKIGFEDSGESISFFLPFLLPLLLSQVTTYWF